MYLLKLPPVEVCVRAKQKIKIETLQNTKLKLYKYTHMIFTRYVLIYKKKG